MAYLVIWLKNKQKKLQLHPVLGNLVFEDYVNFILFAFKIKYRVPKPAVSNL